MDFFQLLMLAGSTQYSLRFANDIYYYWKSNAQSDIHWKPDRSEFRNQIIFSAKTLFSSPENLLKIIDPAYMYSSYHFCVHYSEEKQGGNGFRPAEWRWYAELLLEAGKIDSQTIIPQVSCLIIKEEHHTNDFTYKFDKDLTEDLFKGRVNELMEILSRDIDLKEFDRRESSMIKCAQDVAVKWFREG